MGDLSTHARVLWHVASGRRADPTDAAFIYLELGSFLTDLSQFNDPYAFMVQKWEHRQPGAGAYLDEMLGLARRPGLLAVFLRSIARSITRVVFCDLSLLEAAIAKRLEQMRQQQPLAFALHAGRISQQLLAAKQSKPSEPLDLAAIKGVIKNHKLSSAQFEVLFERHYTQYYPHEHMDMPPFDLPPELGKVEYMRYPSGLSNYLESYIYYLVDELSRLEEDLLAVSDLKGDAGRFLLVRIGHHLHAIEDFYFHSNFSELQYANFSTKSLPRLEEERKRLRRMRFPVFGRGRTTQSTADFFPSPTESADATDLLYTGFFGAQDMYHSMMDAIHGLRSFLIALLGEHTVATISGSPDIPILLRLLIDDKFRQDRARAKFSTSQSKHRKEIMRFDEKMRREIFEGSLWHKTIMGWKDGRFISDEAAADLVRAFEIDVQLINSHQTLASISDEIGLGSTIIDLLLTAESEVIKSASRSLVLDQGTSSVLATFDGASGETIGTHSLMSKDSKRKHPFRDEAFATAAAASRAIAERLLGRVGRASDGKKRVNWRHFLQDFLRFPSDKREAWENQAVYGKTASAIKASEKWIDRPDGTKKERPEREKLEQEYQKIAADAEAGKFARWVDPPLANQGSLSGGKPLEIQALKSMSEPVIDSIT